MNSTNVIIVVLNYVLDKFKAKHAGIYAIVMAILGAVFILATYLQGDIGVHIPSTITTVIQVVTIVIAGLMGSHTPKMNNGSNQEGK